MSVLTIAPYFPFRRIKIVDQIVLEDACEAQIRAIQVHTPVHASWLNQIEIYFSIVQRKVLTPNDFNDLKTLEQYLLDFQVHYEKIAKPFKWKFTKTDLNKVLSSLSSDNLIIESLAA